MKEIINSKQNESENIFEQYLDSSGFQGKWEYEPTIEGKNKKPDYLLDWKGEKYFFEVKELRTKLNQKTKKAAHIDPYPSLRSKINEVRKQFKEYKEYSCSLVVFNYGDSSAVLNPDFIFGAMLGNLGISAVFDAEKGETVAGSERNVFTSGGRMIDDKGKRQQNTTISTIIVLEEFLDKIEVEKAMRSEEKKHGKKFEGPELITVRMKLHKSHHVGNVPRVVVIENPFARIPFPEDLFNGPFDERWKWIEEQDGKIERIYAGNKLKELEALKENTQ